MHCFTKLPPCSQCKGHSGIYRDAKTKRWEHCTCGRLPRSQEQGKLDLQARLDNRLKELKEGKPW